ncbi:MAG: transglutaminase-like cysteine peptidase [Micavibrio sp.]|nr:transglutaminase-like cysteine peptidase [Micavibrio sp.]
MSFSYRTIANLFTTAALGTVVGIGVHTGAITVTIKFGSDIEPRPKDLEPDDDLPPVKPVKVLPHSPEPEPAPAPPVAPLADGGMPAAVVLSGIQGAFARADTNEIGSIWVARWQYGEEQREEKLMQDPANYAQFTRFLAQFNDVRHASLDDIAEKVNDAVNDYITYTPDDVLYHSIDYWASPTETLTYKRGDCEDYAILKYYTLKALGVPDNRLFITLVNSAGYALAGIDHAVLLVNTAAPGEQANYVTLDNIRTNIVPANENGYATFMMMNDEGYWKYRSNYAATGQATGAPQAADKGDALVLDGGRFSMRQDGALLVDNKVVARHKTALNF